MDDIFIKKVRSGDHHAFRYFVSKYKDMAYSIALSIIKEEFASQEVVQDAFMKAFRNLASFSHKSAFSTWFYRIVVNEALNKWKKKENDPVIYTEQIADDVADDGLLTVSLEEDQIVMVNEALQKMNTNESLALRLFYLQGESIKEVCEITGWSESNTKVILHRARKNMLAIMKHLLTQVS